MVLHTPQSSICSHTLPPAVRQLTMRKYCLAVIGHPRSVWYMKSIFDDPTKVGDLEHDESPLYLER